jgi:hypothetical protein
MPTQPATPAGVSALAIVMAHRVGKSNKESASGLTAGRLPEGEADQCPAETIRSL